MVGILIGVGVVALGALLTGCSSDDTGSDFPGEEIPPLDKPPPSETTPDDPTVPLFDCAPPAESSLLLILKGNGIKTPQLARDDQGVPTTGVVMSEATDGCVVLTVERAAMAVDKTGNGEKLWTEAKWANMPSPFLDFNNPNYLNSVNLINGRAMGHKLNDLYRGYPGNPLNRDIDYRSEGSWGSLISTADQNLSSLGNNASFDWFLNMNVKVDETTCKGGIEVWQALRTPDGLTVPDASKDYLALPFYRKEACDALEAIVPEMQQMGTICGGSSGKPCVTVGGTEISQLDARVISLPRDQAEAALGTLQEEELTLGALEDMVDEKVVVFSGQSVEGQRISIPFEFTKVPR